MDRIDSLRNSQLIRIRKLAQSRSFRWQEQAFIIESKKLVSESNAIESVYVRDGVDFEAMAPVYQLSEDRFKSIQTTRHSQGVLAIARCQPKPISLAGCRRILICDGIQNPMNLGAIIRSAVAFNIDAIFLQPGTVDVYHPETVRSAAGLVDAIPIDFLTDEWSALLHSAGFDMMALVSQSSESLLTVKLSERVGFILGNEGYGVQSDWPWPVRMVSIPMHHGVESLNVGVTAGILGYHLHCLDQVNR